MTRIVEIDVLRKKKEAKKKLETKSNFKMLYDIDLDENQLAQTLRNEKRKEKELEWD